MAFCPHCGKSVTEQATKCAACGGELEQRGKGVRFKGTMMMSPGTAPLIQPPNAGQRNTAPAQQPVPAAPAPSASTPPSPTAATMPMPAVGPIADAAAAALAGKKPAALKATMLGTGEAGLAGIAKSLQAQGQAAQAQPAAPAAAPSPAAPAAAPAAAAPQPAATTRREVQAEDDSKRFLVGDPMAPKEDAVPAPPKAQRAPAPRFSSDDMSTELPKDRSATFIIVGIVGVCVIAAIGYIAAKLMGLTN